MNQEQKDTLHEYENLKLGIKEAETRLDELKPLLLQMIKPDQVIATDQGSFTVKSRPKWSYSVDTDNIEKSLKIRKKQEEADGTARELAGTLFVEYRVTR